MERVKKWWKRHGRSRSWSPRPKPQNLQPAVETISQEDEKAIVTTPASTTQAPQSLPLEPLISSKQNLETNSIAPDPQGPLIEPSSTRNSETDSIAPEPQSPPIELPIALEIYTLEEIRYQIWNEAYEMAKEDESELVAAYETILSAQLSTGEPAPSINKAPPNALGEKPLSERQDQMKAVVDMGLSNTRKGAKNKGKIKDGMEPIENLKAFVSMLAEIEPTAATAWAGITVCMDLLGNALSEPAINREGLEYVRDRMQWYWGLSELLFNPHQQSQISSLLRTKLVRLYKQLLIYQMWSVCLYSRNWATVILRDLVKLDNWQEKVDAIKAAEDSLRQDIRQHGSEVQKDLLRSMDNSLRELREEIRSVIEEAARQIQEEMCRIRESKEYCACMKALFVINPHDDKRNLESRKGGLLEDAYSWILQHEAFREFRKNDETRLLWIKGDPGKGKTMLICDEKYKTEGQIFNSHTAFQALKSVLFKILEDPQLENGIIIVDALDECSEDSREELIHLIIECSRDYRTKWIVTSRNWTQIEAQFHHENKSKLSLELNKDSIAQAVKAFIDIKVNDLAYKRDYDQKLKGEVREILLLKANDTFLWVSLVCLKLGNYRVRNWQVMEILNSIPADLKSLYRRMLDQVLNSEEANFQRSILATALTAFRPLHINELCSLVEGLDKHKSTDVEEMVRDCGSFLTINDSIVYLVHQSAKDFLLLHEDEVFSSNIMDQHRTMFFQSLNILKRLKRDIYELNSPGAILEDISTPNPDPLSGLEYSCLHWANHLAQLKDQEGENSTHKAVKEFMENQLLHWLEALSLRRKIAEGVLIILELKRIMQNTTIEGLAKFIEDTRRFVLRHREVLHVAPLQVYVSALVFSPVNSLVRRQFDKVETGHEIVPLGIEPHWNARTYTFGGSCNRVALSPTSHQLVCGLKDGTIEVWDLTSSRCTRTLKHAGDYITALALSPDETRLVVGSTDAPGLQIFDFSSGTCIRKMEDPEGIPAVAFSPDSKWFASCSRDDTVTIWDANDGEFLRTMTAGPKNHISHMHSVEFSVNGQRLASSRSHYKFGLIDVWDAATGQHLQTLEDGQSRVSSIAFLADGTLASAGGTIKIWDVTTGACLRTLDDGDLAHLVHSLDNGRIASVSLGGNIKIWDSQGLCVQTIGTKAIRSLSFCSRTQLLASGSDYGANVWDLRAPTSKGTTNLPHTWEIDTIALSPNGLLCASHSKDNRLKIWDAKNGVGLRTLDNYSSKFINSLEFSPNGRWLLSYSYYRDPEVYDTANGKLMATIKFGSDLVFTSPSSVLVLVGYSGLVQTWDFATQKAPGKFMDEGTIYYQGIAFCPKTEKIATARGHEIFIHNVVTGQLMKALDVNGHETINSLYCSSSGKYLASETCHYVDIWSTETYSCIERVTIPGDGLSFEGFNKENDYQIYFDEKGCPYQMRGYLDWGATLSDRTLPAPLLHNYSQCGDGDPWITDGGRKILWLPQEYRHFSMKDEPLTVVAGETTFIATDQHSILLIRPTDRSLA